MGENKDLDLISVFSKIPVKLLREVANDLNIKIHKRINKKELSKLIANAILNDPQGLLDILYTYELKHIKKVIENTHLKSSINPGLLLSPIYLYEISGSKVVSDSLILKMNVFPKDLIEAISPLLDVEISKRDLKPNKDIETFMLGLTTLKGCINEQNIINQLKESSFGTVTVKSYSKLLKRNSKLFSRMYKPCFDVYASSYMDENHKVQLPSVMFDLNNEPLFSNEDIRAASDVLNPKFHVSYSNRLKKRLKEEGFSKNEIDGLLMYIWWRRQSDKRVDLFEFIPSDKNIKDVPMMLYDICTYYNFLPMWKYRGRYAFGVGEDDVIPPVLWDISNYCDRPDFCLDDYIEHLCWSVSKYYEDSIYWDKEENLFLYIDNEYVWTLYVGTDEAKNILDYYKRIPFPAFVKFHPTYKEMYASKKLVKKFIQENCDMKKLNQKVRPMV